MIREVDLNFTFMFKFFPYLMITPWMLYMTGIVLAFSSVWERGRRERFITSIVFVAAATFILAVIVWPSSMSEIAEIIKANYYFPKEGG